MRCPLHMMKIAPVTRIAFAVVIALALAPASPLSAADSTNDLVALAQSSWGISIDKFPDRAGLKAGEYSQGKKPPPLPQDVDVIMPFYQQTQGRWTPQELFPLEFDFAGAAGLQKITGFLPSGTSQDAVVARIIDSYGQPSKSATALNMTTYAWEIGNTTLEISPILFELFPTNHPPN